MAHDKLSYITKVQSFGVLLVVLGHSVIYKEGNGADAWGILPFLHGVIYSFHMPLFMAISGFLFIYTNERRELDYPTFVIGKAKRLLIPYLVLSTVAFLIKSALPEYSIRKLSFTEADYLHGLLYPLQNPIINFWFLPTLFIVFMIAPLLIHYLTGKQRTMSLVIGALLAALSITNPIQSDLFNLSGVAGYLVFFYLGCLLATFRAQIAVIKPTFVLIGTCVLLFGMNALLLQFSSQYLKFLTALVGIIFGFSVALFITERNSTLFQSIDNYYYQIFLLSWFFHGIFRTLYQMHHIGYWTAIVAMIVSGLYGPVLLTSRIAVRVPWMNLLLGTTASRR